MGNDDARSLDHTHPRGGQRAGGRKPLGCRAHFGCYRTDMYGWLARYRRGGWGGLKAKPLFGRAEIDVHPLFFGHRLDLRVFFLEPLPNQRLIAFDRAMQWLLTSDADLRQQPANGICGCRQ